MKHHSATAAAPTVLTSAALASILGQSQRTAQRVLKEALGPANGAWRKVEREEQPSLFGHLGSEQRHYGLRRKRASGKTTGSRNHQPHPDQLSLL